MAQVKLTIEDMIPARSTFKLSTKGEQVFELRPLNAEDKMWIIRNFGNQADIERMFDKQEWDKLARIVYRLMDQDSRQAFFAQEVEELDDEGVKRKYLCTGPMQLQRAMVGINDQSAVLKALLETIGLSTKILEALLAEHEEQKKKELSKVAPKAPPLAGAKSTTPSPQNTGGRSKKSASTRSPKSKSR